MKGNRRSATIININPASLPSLDTKCDRSLLHAHTGATKPLTPTLCVSAGLIDKGWFRWLRVGFPGAPCTPSVRRARENSNGFCFVLFFCCFFSGLVTDSGLQWYVSAGQRHGTRGQADVAKGSTASSRLLLFARARSAITLSDGIVVVPPSGHY